MKGFKLLAMLVLLCLTSLIFNFPNITLTNAASSNTGEYQEDCSIIIGAMNGDILLSFTFSNVTGLFDASSLAADPSFIWMMVIAGKINESYKLAVSLSFNESLVSLARGKFKADVIIRDLSSIFGTSIPFQSNFTAGGLRSFGYGLDDYPPQNLENIFLAYIPSQGFAELITPGLNYTTFSFGLTPETMFPFEGPLMWKVSAMISYPDYLDISPGYEYQLSLKNLMNYPYSIKASPDASISKITLSFMEDTKKVKFLFLETTPQMRKEEQRVGNYKMTTFTVELSPGSSIEDVSIHFKIASPGYINPTTIAVAVGVVTVLMLVIVVIIIRKKRKLSQYEARPTTFIFSFATKCIWEVKLHE